MDFGIEEDNMIREEMIEKVDKRIADIEADSRYQRQSATIEENAPLALIQLEMETEIRILRWVSKNLKQE